MDKFLISEKYRLEFHWDKVRYNKDGIALIDGCYFGGPAVKEIEVFNESDFIDLDFSNQYIIFLANFYIARLFWKNAKRRDTQIFLYDVRLENKNINVVPKLRHNDYIVVDTKNHEEQTHKFYLTYMSYLLKSDETLYKF